ncbi:Pseudouridine-5'-monophosphatase [Toxocara canis]|uniref:Pseudouridine-5'-monophosphatase n=1 Tax=Toxocara canis TaxID=6265 RepID=A0A0B2UV94_TOXCA|nr:Pseudouridine-5'-monophosphatase [Toxocara canis]
MGEADRPSITHVIFDLDGLLVDTEPTYTEVNQRTMARFGKEFRLDLKPRTMGMKHDAAIQLMLDAVGLFGLDFHHKTMGEADRPSITHVIFDLDGLLVDTEPTYTEVNQRTMARFGKEFRLDLKPRTMGMKHDAAIQLMLDAVGLHDKVSVAEYCAIYDPDLRARLPYCPMMKGAMRLVRHLAKHNIPMAICSGSRTREFNLKVQNHKELTDLIPLQVRASDDPEIAEGKPAPDAFLVTMRRFAVKPADASNVLVFEDAPNGVLAAVAAGMHVVMVPDLSYASPPESVKHRIAFVLNSLEDFKPESMGLPPYD